MPIEEIRRRAGLVLRRAEDLRFGRRWKRPNVVRYGYGLRTPI